MRQFRFFLSLLAVVLLVYPAAAQKKDSTRAAVLRADSGTAKATDSVTKKKHDPHKATMRSLIVPGWGQIYNRKYWKLPLVYGALGITGYIFNYNRVQYNKVKFAYFALINKDTGSYPLVTDPVLQKWVQEGNTYALQSYRNSYRKDIDYSVLFFLFFWALNVVDATVDGHLKDFDVSDDLSMKIKPVFYAAPSAPLGISVVFNIGKHPLRQPVPLH